MKFHIILVFCYINLSNLLWTKGFDIINFPLTRNDRVWKMRLESRFCNWSKAEVVNPAWDSHFYNKIIPCIGNFIVEKPWVKPIWHINRQGVFFNFCCFPGNKALERETNHIIVKCCEKNKMDNAQNGYSSADNTGKIKKIPFLEGPFHFLLFRLSHIFLQKANIKYHRLHFSVHLIW